MIGDEGEGAALEHFPAKISEDRTSLGVQVPEHLIGAPATQESDDICVNSSTEESIGTCSSETACSYVRWEDSNRRAKILYSKLDGMSNVSRLDFDNMVVCIINMC